MITLRALTTQYITPLSIPSIGWLFTSLLLHPCLFSSLLPILPTCSLLFTYPLPTLLVCSLLCSLHCMPFTLLLFSTVCLFTLLLPIITACSLLHSLHCLFTSLLHTLSTCSLLCSLNYLPVHFSAP